MYTGYVYDQYYRPLARHAAKELAALAGESAVREIVCAAPGGWQELCRAFNAAIRRYEYDAECAAASCLAAPYLGNVNRGLGNLIARLIAQGELPGEGECTCTPLSSACDACRVQALTVPLEEIF